MHVFSAEVPALEVPRAEIVAARVARKVAPLFGVPIDADPFNRTWVCDFTALSLAELGRGAPAPSRADQSRLDMHPPSTSDTGGGGDAGRPWAWAGRTVWTPGRAPTPGALTNATLNRFGPDTKAAAVLTGANRLLRASTAAVAAVARHLADTGCHPEVRLAVWAGLVLEVYRGQPALVVAAIQARMVQRSLSAHWGGQVVPTALTEVPAPSEISVQARGATGGKPPAAAGGQPPVATDAGASDEPQDPTSVEDRAWRPTTLDLVDATLPLLGLAEDTSAGPALVTREVLDDLASVWCQRLLAVGRPGRGVVWLSEDPAGSRRVHVMVRVGAVVAPFVAAAIGCTAMSPSSPRPPAPPVLPSGADLAGLPVRQRRAHLLAAHIATNYLRYRDELLAAWPGLRQSTRDSVDQAVQRCAEVLAPDDPVAVQLTAYAGYLAVWDLLRTPDPHRDPATLAAAVDRLAATERSVTEAWRTGHLDPGAASYLLEITAVAMAEAAPGTDHQQAMARWSTILATRGLDQATDPVEQRSDLPDAQVFHLQHYTAMLATTGRRADLRRALALQEQVVAVRAAVVRGEPATFAAKSVAARTASQLAAAIATDLALAVPAREHGPRVAALTAAARHAAAVLADPSVRPLLATTTDQPTTPASAPLSPAETLTTPSGPLTAPVGTPALPVARRTALVVARALALATDHGVHVAPADAGQAVRLLDLTTGTGPGEDPDPAISWRSRLVAAADPPIDPTDG